MILWKSDNTNTIHTLAITETNESSIKNAIEQSAAKIIDSLSNNIADDSLYLLFEWNPDHAVLAACVTDANKQHDASQQIVCEFSGLRMNFERLNAAQKAAQQNELTENVKFWLHDYLTTCTAFLKFSLVAIFHASSRENTELL